MQNLAGRTNASADRRIRGAAAKPTSTAIGLLLLLLFPLGSCRSHGPTRAGEVGRWTVTSYMVRRYRLSMEKAHETAKRLFEQQGFTVHKSEVKSAATLLHGFQGGNRRSMIIRCKRTGRADLVCVEMKVGPAHRVRETETMMNAFQRLLPKSAQPK